MLRLQWDQVRWQVMSESKGLLSEVDSVVRDKARWSPAEVDVTSRGSPRYLPRSPSCRGSVTPVTPKSSMPRTDTLASDLASAHLGSSPQHKQASESAVQTASPARHLSTPDRSLHIPLLHSQLVNLRIRHKNITSTHLARSGAILDRMIDVASHLQNLGDVNGPCTKNESLEGGAVPYQLLDLQDELDASVEELGRRVAWCGELEEHWKLYVIGLHVLVNQLMCALLGPMPITLPLFKLINSAWNCLTTCTRPYRNQPPANDTNNSPNYLEKLNHVSQPQSQTHFLDHFTLLTPKTMNITNTPRAL